MRLPERLTRFRCEDSGAVAVEFVLIAPMLFTLLFGIVVLSYFMGLTHSVHQLATGAARASVAGLDATERDALAQAYLSQAGVNYPLLVPEALTPQVQIVDGSLPGITVSLRYDIDGSLLDIANGFLGLGITEISGSAYLAY